MLELAYSEFNSEHAGIPVVIAHGLFGSKANWRSIASQLADDYHVYAVDLRNHGESPRAPSMSYQEMAEDLAGFIRHYCGGRANVLGHSMGGKVAMTLALMHPNTIQTLAVVDIAPHAYDSYRVHAQLVAAMQSVDLSTIETRGQADDALSSFVGDRAIRQFLLQSLTRDEKGYRWRLNLPVINESLGKISAFPNLAAAFNGPASFIYGTASDYVLAEYQREIECYFPQSEMFPVGGAGHWLHAEQPHQLVDILKRLFPRSSA